ncbi:MAG: prolyl oligopeptidase family serine peptidase [Actinomycetaceae bacterium]|nr:prolyl oligopeptidase family serine peptidase [Actinomycetaceae bacterium]
MSLLSRRPFFTHLAAWVVLVVSLGVWGTVAGPLWNPQPMSDVLTPETEDTAIGVSEPSGQIGQYEVAISVEEIELRDGQKVSATIRRPVGYEGLAPAMLFIHGTGTQSHTAFHREAQAIASTGIITIVPDKRTSDYTLTHRDYEKLAKDFSDVFDYLVSIDGVDPQRSGLYAVSEGCFIAPVVAAGNPAVSYVALISAPVLPIREQGAWAADTYLRALGVPEKVLTGIPRLIGQNFDEDTFDYIDFDVSVYQRQMTQPVFLAYGTGDISMPIIQAPLLLSEDLAQAGNENLTIRYYKDADHGLQIGDHVLLLSAMQDVADWVSGLPYTADSLPRIAGAQPTQTYMADIVTRTYWFASGSVGLYILAGALLLILLSLIMSAVYSLIHRVRRNHAEEGTQSEPVPMKAINIASAVLICAVIGLLAYMGALAYLATSYSHSILITYGGWLALCLLSLGAAWLSIIALSKVLSWYREEKGRAIALVPRCVVWTAFFGQLTLFMALAYWGVFPSLI